ncbi:hypothetical protein [Sphingomonas mali]|uniref:hypothetical protein n=1 Tax=Sphingomonas mali TaxID=40682 RepID=UPI00082EAE91|nr:hypothetical protein [Sphingomonas mali]
MIGLALLLAGTPMVPGMDQATSDAAECVVDNDIRDVRALLKTVPGSPSETEATSKVLVYYGGCSDNKMAAGTFSWRERAEIAEAALAPMLRKSPDVAGAVARDGWALAMPANAKPADYAAVTIGVRMMGDCLVRANPQGSLALLRSDRGSADEASAINSLSGNIAACVPAGQLLKLKRQDLRLVVAEPLYHLLSR